MKKVEEGFTEHLLVDFPPGISTQLVQLKVSKLSVFNTIPAVWLAVSSLLQQQRLSLLGWTPSTFKSDRSTRADKKSFRPEDFMDKDVK